MKKNFIRITKNPSVHFKTDNIHGCVILCLFDLTAIHQVRNYCQAQSRKAVQRRLDNGGRPDILPQAKQDVKDFNRYCPIKFKYCKKIKNLCPIFVDKCKFVMRRLWA